MKKLIFIFLSLMLLISLTACSSNSSNSASSSNSNSNSDNSNSVKPNDSQQKVELTFWDTLFRQDDNTPTDQWFIAQAIKKFEQEDPNITIKRVQQTEDIQKYDNLFRAAAIAKNGPDMATLYAGGDVLSFSQFLVPLGDDFKQEQSQLSGWDSVKENFQPDGQILAVPYGAGSYFEIFYNKKLMKQAGIDVVNFTPPATWEDFIKLAQKIKAAGITPVVAGEQEGYTGAWVMATLEGGQSGTDGFFNMRSGKLPVNDASMINAYKNYQDLYALGLTNKDAGSKKNGEGNQMFYQGKGAMLIGGGWGNKEVYDALKDDVGNFPIPTLAGSTHAGGIAGGPNVALVVPKYSKHQKEAIKFIKFLTRPDILDLYVKIKQVESSNHKDADLSVIQNPLLKNQAEWLKKQNTIYPFDNIMPQEVNDLFYRMNAQTFMGHISPKQAADQLQDANQKILSKKK